MKDITLWRALLATRDVPVAERGPALAAREKALQQLAKSPLRERFPFLGLCIELYEGASPSLRRVLLSVLNDARGLPARRLMVRALDDPSREVRLQAIQTLLSSVRSDPPRWVHALFARRADVRRAALEAGASLHTAGYGLLLAVDPECHPTLLEHLPERVPDHRGGWVLGLGERGLLPPAECARLLLAGNAAPLLWLVRQGARETRLRNIARKELKELAEGQRPDFGPREMLVVDRVVRLFWDEPEAGRGIWASLSTQLRSSRHSGLRDRVATAVLFAGVELGRWNLDAAGLLVFLPFLDYAWLPVEVRRAGLAGLQEPVQGLRHNATFDQMLRWIESPLCRTASPLRYDLARLAAVLRMPQPKVLAKVIDALDMQRLARGFDRDPEAGLRLTRQLFTAREKRTAFLAKILEKSTLRLTETLALAASQGRDEVFDLVEQLKPNELRELFQRLLDREAEAGDEPGLRETGRLARHLGTGLAAHQPGRFLKGWLGRKDAARTSRFAVEVLGFYAQALSPKKMWRLVSALSRARLHIFLVHLEACVLFPFASEMKLAHELRASSDPEARNWAEGRLRAGPPAPPRADRDAKVSGLSPKQQRLLRGVPEERLAEALEPCLRAPRRGLCAALASRPLPERPHLKACLALLACGDPPAEVALQFLRFGCPGGAFLSRLDAGMVATWEGTASLSLLGHAWLHRWTAHRARVAEAIGSDPARLRALLTEAAALPSPVLAGQMWEAVAGLCNGLRFHDKPRLQALCPPDTLELLLAHLDGRLGVSAARCLARFAAIATANQRRHWGRRVAERLPDCRPEVTAELSSWVDVRGLVPGVGARPRPAPGGFAGALATSDDLEALRNALLSYDAEEAQDAALRLLALGARGCAVIATVLEEHAVPRESYAAAAHHVPHAGPIAEVYGLLPEGPALARLTALARSAPGELGFTLLLCHLEREGREATEAEAARLIRLVDEDTNPVGWFIAGHWTRLVALGLAEHELAFGLVGCAQPRAYVRALDVLADLPHGDDVADALRRFLASDSRRMWRERVRAAQLLVDVYEDNFGFPVLISDALRDEGQTNPFVACDEELAGLGVGAVLAAGPQNKQEQRLVKLLLARRVPAAVFDAVARRLVRELSSNKPRFSIVRRLRGWLAPTRTPDRKLAESFAWGVRRGRELLGKVYDVVMHSGKELGFTRIGQRSIQVTPLPILKEEQRGEDIVRGLIVHEFGHQLYHSDPDAMLVWKEAQKLGLQGLLNLVADEHLERNLRALDKADGDRLKRLASYAFHHLTREVEVEKLLSNLGLGSAPVLTRTRLEVAIDAGKVVVKNGEVLGSLARDGSSFVRFVRALRMGLGNRYADPKVAEALELFPRDFRHSNMRELLKITRQLKELFGDETGVLEEFGLHPSLEPGDGELSVFGEGLTQEELQDQVDRLLNKPRPLDPGPPQKGRGGLALNVGKDESFPPIPKVVPMPYDPAKAREYAATVRRPAQTMRRFLEQLGLRLEREPRRISGRSLDRGSLPRVIIQGDPRMMVARRLRSRADLFLGLLIDCSGSMGRQDNMHKARLFGSLLAEAVRGLAGVDLRVFGFTAAELFDCGSARQCSVASLEASGGNNDAGALHHVAQLAQRSGRQGKLLVMISDGLPTECTADALSALVRRLSRKGICCAQVAVQPLKVVCFPHYVLLGGDASLGETVRKFGRTVARLVRKTIR